MSSPFTPFQYLLLTLMGASFGLNGLFIIRFLGSYGVFAPGWLSIGFFLATIPLGILAAEIGTRVLKVKPDQYLVAVAIMCVAALAFDAIVLTWWPSFYGAGDAVVRGAAAWLLWGVACSLGFALWKSGKPA